MRIGSWELHKVTLKKLLKSSYLESHGNEAVDFGNLIPYRKVIWTGVDQQHRLTGHCEACYCEEKRCSYYT